MNTKTLKVVLDSNIYISAVLFGGKPGEVYLHGIRKSYDLFVSLLIVEEVENCLQQKFYWSKRETIVYSTQIKKIATVHEVKTLISGVCRDPKDDHILSLAVATNANYIISGDKDLLSLTTFEDIKIINAECFLKPVLSAVLHTGFPAIPALLRSSCNPLLPGRRLGRCRSGLQYN